MHFAEIRNIDSANSDFPPAVSKKDNPLYAEKIVLTIFSFLNVSSILANRYVCKRWNKIVSNTVTLSIAKTKNALEIAEVVVAAFSKEEPRRKR